MSNAWAQTVTTAWAQTVTNLENYGMYGTKYHILPMDHIYLVPEWKFYTLTKYCTISYSVYVLHRVSMYYVTVVPKIDEGNQDSEPTMEK